MIRKLVLFVASVVFLAACAGAPQSPMSAQPAQPAPAAQPVAEGKPTFIEFYATWCGSCLAMKPVVSKLRDAYGDRVVFQSYNIDDPASAELMQKYRYVGRPQFVIVKPDGSVLATRVGVFPYERLQADLEAALKP
ncbi:MAG: thioredoxin domain-containing protein [Anaerolineae bacterium]|nr:thioredoxin domain-containing protein [Thermoflexales bacterium]MDW8396288.1 thioredoxin domain-containing protein [Anaerolineae bacterium]